MQQLLSCQRCGDLQIIDLGLPADLCRRCLRTLGFPGPEDLTDRDLEVLENAWVVVEGDGLTWPAAVHRARREA